MGALPLTAASAGPQWWWPLETDSAWTNRPIEEIRVAAQRAEPAAQYYFGRTRFLGLGGPRDVQEALTWTRRAAEQGYAPAQLTIGRAYYTGAGVTEDYQEGFSWMSRAAGQGLPDAMGIIGRAYEYGEGVPQSATNALQWLLRAVGAGSRNAAVWVGDFYRRGEARTARPTNYVEALRWYERAASNGITSAMCKAADLCQRGQGTPPDLDRALHWLRTAADKGDLDAAGRLARFYAVGWGEPRTPEETPVWLFRRVAARRAILYHALGPDGWERDASYGLTDACGELCWRYRSGIGTARDYVAAAEWTWVAYQEHRRAVASGQVKLVPSQFEPILKGKSPAVTADERLWQQAVRLVHEALEESRAETLQRIGENYRDGSSLTPQQPLFAWSWFNRAAELGHGPAREALKALESTFSVEELARAKYFWVPPPLQSKPNPTQ